MFEVGPFPKNTWGGCSINFKFGEEMSAFFGDGGSMWAILWGEIWIFWKEVLGVFKIEAPKGSRYQVFDLENFFIYRLLLKRNSRGLFLLFGFVFTMDLEWVFDDSELYEDWERVNLPVAALETFTCVTYLL